MPFLYVPKIEDSQGLSESSSKKQNKTKGKKKKSQNFPFTLYLQYTLLGYFDKNEWMATRSSIC